MKDRENPEEQRANLVRSLWLVAAAMTIHEIEEWNIASWTARNFTNHTGVSDQAIWLGLIAITCIFVGWIAAATRLRNPISIALAALPAVGLVALSNSVQHITWTFLFAEYAPGVVSAVLLIIPASCLALWRILSVGRLFVPLVFLSAGLCIAAAVQIVQAGRVMQPFQVVIHQVCISLATAIGVQATK